MRLRVAPAGFFVYGRGNASRRHERDILAWRNWYENYSLPGPWSRVRVRRISVFARARGGADAHVERHEQCMEHDQLELEWQCGHVRGQPPGRVQRRREPPEHRRAERWGAAGERQFCHGPRRQLRLYVFRRADRRQHSGHAERHGQRDIQCLQRLYGRYADRQRRLADGHECGRAGHGPRYPQRRLPWRVGRRAGFAGRLAQWRFRRGRRI